MTQLHGRDFVKEGIPKPIIIESNVTASLTEARCQDQIRRIAAFTNVREGDSDREVNRYARYLLM